MMYPMDICIKVALCTTGITLSIIMVCENLKFKITVYFVTSVHKMILNIVSSKL